jgi:hypothetical protein
MGNLNQRQNDNPWITFIETTSDSLPATYADLGHRIGELYTPRYTPRDGLHLNLISCMMVTGASRSHWQWVHDHVPTGEIVSAATTVDVNSPIQSAMKLALVYGEPYFQTGRFPLHCNGLSNFAYLLKDKCKPIDKEGAFYRELKDVIRILDRSNCRGVLMELFDDAIDGIPDDMIETMVSDYAVMKRAKKKKASAQ